MSAGAVEPLKALHRRWGHDVQFIDVIIRQAHPGPDVPAYDRFQQKEHDARRYQHEEAIPWPVLIDDIQGRVHQVYGNLADPTYLIDRDGRVAFYNMWTDAPTLHDAIAALLDREGRGVVNGGLSRSIHLGPSLTVGWRGLRRGWPQSFTDLMIAAPGTPILTWLGYQIRPALAPLTLRATPLPASVRLAVALGVGVLAGMAAFGWHRGRRAARTTRAWPELATLRGWRMPGPSMPSIEQAARKPYRNILRGLERLTR